ncbi:hypothetical protein GCM10027610_075120 [Dactylosporangium cerinum]
MDVDREAPGAPARPDVVILVHGTFAGPKDDTDDEPGDAWWQRDSDYCRWLRANLPPGAALPDDVQVFRWTGHNSQVRRLEAANRLLALMIELEAQGRGYHLVGHSHGGSLIWEALISAEVPRTHGVVYAQLRRALNDPSVRLAPEPIIPLRDDEHAPWFVKHKTRYLPRTSEFRAIEAAIQLRGLRSWTTVGSPFLRYLPARRPAVPGWGSQALSLRPATGWRAVRRQLLDLLVTTTITAPFSFLAVLIVAGAMFHARWPGAVMHSGVANALALPVVLCWAAAYWLLGAQGYANTLLARERAAQRAFRRHAPRWLGLWAPTDEAINVLSASAPTGVDYEWLCAPADRRDRRDFGAPSDPVPLPRLRIRAPRSATHLLPDVVRIAPRRAAVPLVWLANRLLEPWWRRRIAAALHGMAQGSDLPAAVLAFASPWPLPLRGARTVTGLPDEVAARLADRAAGQNAALGPALRELLMAAALDGVPAAMRGLHGSLTEAGAMVHTSYFADPDVRELIRLHIERTCTISRDTTAGPLAAWLTEHQAAVAARVAAFAVTPPSP